MIMVRRFALGDAAPVIELITQIMSQEFGEAKAAYPTEDIQNIQTSYGALGEAFLVASDEDKIVGTIGVKKEDDRVALMRRLFVASAYRRRNIGRQLIENAVQFCGEVGYQEVVFKTTSKMVQAIELCKKCGFVQRAKLQLGPIELLKFSLPIRDHVKVGRNHR